MDHSDFEQIGTSFSYDRSIDSESNRSQASKMSVNQEGLESLVPLVNKLQNALS